MNWREISIAVPQKTSETHPHAAAATRRTYRWLLEPILPLIERCKNFRISRPRTPEARISPKEIFSRVSSGMPASLLRLAWFWRAVPALEQDMRLSVVRDHAGGGLTTSALEGRTDIPF